MDPKFLLFVTMASSLTLTACGGSTAPDTEVGSDPADPGAGTMPLARLMTNVANIESYQSTGVAGRTRDAFTYQYTYSSPSPRPWFGSEAANSRVETLITKFDANPTPSTTVSDYYSDPGVPYRILGLRTGQGNSEQRVVTTDSLVPLPETAQDGWSEVIQTADFFGPTDNFTRAVGTRTSTGTVRDDEFCVLDKIVQPRVTTNREFCYQTNSNGDVLRIRLNASVLSPIGNEFVASAESVGPIKIADSAD